MTLITLREIFDIIIMTVAVGYIFMDSFKKTEQYSSFDWKVLWFSCIVAAPGLILHELAHKFVALSFGMQAVFHAAYTWLGIGIALKLLGAGLIFFVPGYVQISGGILPGAHALVAFAGPALNLVMYLVAKVMLQEKNNLKHRTFLFWTVTKQLNGFLFIFNMLPIPLFDGWSVYKGIWQVLV
ncbi:MAG: hypothetical protein Q7K43_01570 [Candidatus Woesearchaeota archaeon]|nr:hypothetical protein [Candidatus Woesearchaeota archaeon]